MRGRLTCAGLLTCTLIALLAGAAGAVAKPGYFVFPGYRSAELNLKGSNGYRVNIAKQGNRVFLLASKEPSIVVYAARSLSRDGIEARFPGVGHVSMRFLPQGPHRIDMPHPFPGCKGGAVTKQPGHFVGTVRFRGERGYTSVRATRVPATIETTAKEVCKRLGEDPKPKQERIELFAVSESGKRGVGFSASTTVIPEVTSTTTFGASVLEFRRGMSIFRDTWALGQESDVALGDTRPFPLSATFTPPPPFQGSAEFQRDSEGESTWTGSLTVPLPGLGRVVLTGPSFTPRLCQRSGCTGNTVDGRRLPTSAAFRPR